MKSALAWERLHGTAGLPPADAAGRSSSSVAHRNRKRTGRSKSFPPSSCLPVSLELPPVGGRQHGARWVSRQKRGVRGPRWESQSRTWKGRCGLRGSNSEPAPTGCLEVWFISTCLGNFLSSGISSLLLLWSVTTMNDFNPLIIL